MADLDNTINEKKLKSAYAGTGHPLKDKLLKFLEEVQSDLNSATSNVIVLKAASPTSSNVTTLSSDIVAAFAPLRVDSSASTLVALGSQMVANESATMALVSNFSAMLSNIGFDLADECYTTASGSSFTAVISQICAGASNAEAKVDAVSGVLSQIGFDYGDEGTTTASGSSFTAVFSQVVADASNANKGHSDISAFLSNLGFDLGDTMAVVPSDSSFTALISQTVDNIKAVSDAYTAVIPSDVLDLYDVASDNTTIMSNHITMLSNLTILLEGETAAVPSKSTFSNLVSQIVVDSSNLTATVSNQTALFSDMGFTGGDELFNTPGSSEFSCLISALVAQVSDTSTLFSDIGFLLGDEMDTVPSSSTFTALMSQIVANYSNLYADVNDNIKSNVTALEAQESDLTVAMVTIGTKYTSDVAAGMGGSDSCSDLIVHISDLMVLLSNALIND